MMAVMQSTNYTAILTFDESLNFEVIHAFCNKNLIKNKILLLNIL